jgi:hypothetical protein
MSTQPSYQTKRLFTPEERSSYMAWRFGSTLDWTSKILLALNYPIAELRWFVDAVQGLCKGKELRIAHSTLAKRSERFKNKAQASDLARRAIEANNDWARTRLCMIFDIERPKPGEMEGKDKRARTKYTDYLTPAAVWAQETEHKVKKSDESNWKKDHKYRYVKQQEILAEALKMLPGFERVEDMPGTTPKDPKTLSLSEYVEQREKILLAENRRIIARVCDGELTDIDEIDSRLATLEVFHQKSLHELEKSYQSTRDVLLGLKKTRLTRAINFVDADELMAEFDKKVAEKGVADLTLVDTPNDAQTGQIGAQKGKTGDPLVMPVVALSEPQKGKTGNPLVDPVTTLSENQTVKTGDPLVDPVTTLSAPQIGKTGNPLVESVVDCETDSSGTSIEGISNGYLILKGKTGDPLSDPVEAALTVFDEAAETDSLSGDIRQPVRAAEAAAQSATEEPPVMIDWALFWASNGIPVFPVYSVTPDGICKCRDKSQCKSTGKHPKTFRGSKEASTDPEIIKRWWKADPLANIGGVTGGAVRLLVVDCDPRHGGDASLHDLVEAHGSEWLDTLQVKTGGSGHHFFYNYPADVELRNTANKLAPGIDTRADGGYVVMAPSLHASLNRYALANMKQTKPAPDWLIEELTRPADVQPSKVVNFQEKKMLAFPGGAIIRDGERDNRMFKIGSALWNTGITPDEMYTKLLAIRDERCEVGTQFFSDEQVRAKVDSVYRQAAQKGWSLPTADDATAENQKEANV